LKGARRKIMTTATMERAEVVAAAIESLDADIERYEILRNCAIGKKQILEGKYSSQEEVFQRLRERLEAKQCG
jgi:hypothetical protein